MDPSPQRLRRGRMDEEVVGRSSFIRMLWWQWMLLWQLAVLGPCPVACRWVPAGDGYSSGGVSSRAHSLIHNVTMVWNGAWPTGLVKGVAPFAGAVVDGNGRVWFVPHTANGIVVIAPSTGEMSLFDKWPESVALGSYAFVGGVCTGNYVWLVPFSADAVVRVAIDTGDMVSFHGWPTGLSR